MLFVNSDVDEYSTLAGTPKCCQASGIYQVERSMVVPDHPHFPHRHQRWRTMFIATSMERQFPFAFVTFLTKHADNGAHIVVIVTVNTHEDLF
jgi:hypothetical protein